MAADKVEQIFESVKGLSEEDRRDLVKRIGGLYKEPDLNWSDLEKEKTKKVEALLERVWGLLQLGQIKCFPGYMGWLCEGAHSIEFDSVKIILEKSYMGRTIEIRRGGQTIECNANTSWKISKLFDRLSDKLNELGKKEEAMKHLKTTKESCWVLDEILSS